MQIPPFLMPGDTIGLLCPAGFMMAEKANAAQGQLEAWGFRVRRGRTIGGPSTNYFSGTDGERLADLQAMLDDHHIRAILCARGGYGLSRIIDGVSFKKFRQHPKWILGYSDITLLHAHIHSRYKIATVHSPMAGAFNEPADPNPWTASMRSVLTGKPTRYEGPALPFSRPGECSGPLVGGNLALLAHAVGSRSELKTKGRILFLEDIGEYKYNIDRMLRQLKRAGAFDKVAGVLIGHFSGNKDTERPFGQPVEEIIRDVFADYDYPVCFGFPVGHETENYALKCGVRHQLSVSTDTYRLQE